LLSTLILLALTFASLGLLLGFAASFDAPRILPEDIGARDPETQSKLFEDCIKDAKFDGSLDEDEYYRCAYGIYG
jgi:hypothetical protein